MLSISNPLDNKELKNASTVLILGCGGGFDCFQGLPLYYDLKFGMGKNVILGNIAFTSLEMMDSNTERIINDVGKIDGGEILKNKAFIVTAHSDNNDLEYFPEKYLCQYLLEKKFEEKPFIYTFSNRLGPKLVKEIYLEIIKKHEIDYIILIDGGNDSLMFGNEEKLGSPQEDSTSITALYTLPLNIIPMENRLLIAIGAGVDHYHGVNSVLFLENTSTIIQGVNSGYKGVFSLLREQDSFKFFKEACDFTFKKMPNHVSIVSSSIIAAVEGHFGNYHPKAIANRTRGTTLFINPMMGMFWVYSIEAVGKYHMYLQNIKEKKTMSEVTTTIYEFRKNLKSIRKSQQFPH
ncbi:hypothetical protein ABK040_015571 [Willaertia magna]